MGETLSTNLSLRTPIPDGIDRNDSVALLGSQAVNVGILERSIAGVQSAVVNATVINTGGSRIVFCQNLSAGSIASITGMITGMPFTLLFQSTGSCGILDTGVFKLNGNLLPGVNTTLTLVWDGTNYCELGRSANG